MLSVKHWHVALQSCACVLPAHGRNVCALSARFFPHINDFWVRYIVDKGNHAAEISPFTIALPVTTFRYRIVQRLPYGRGFCSIQFEVFNCKRLIFSNCLPLVNFLGYLAGSIIFRRQCFRTLSDIQRLVRSHLWDTFFRFCGESLCSVKCIPALLVPYVVDELVIAIGEHI